MPESIVGSHPWNVGGRRYHFSMIIECETCTMREIACDDCVISSLLLLPVSDETEVSDRTVDALKLLSSRGIVAPLRYRAEVQG
jgi:hypothetical protein